MIEAVDYVVRPDYGKRFSVWMIELDASVTPAKVVREMVCVSGKSRDVALKQRDSLRRRDEIHIDKVRAVIAAGKGE